MNTATQLLEQAMEELIQGRDGFITAMQIDSREETIKDIEAYLRSNVAKQQVEQEPKSEFQRGYDLAISTTKQHIRHLNDELARWQEQHSKMMKQEPAPKYYWDCECATNFVHDRLTEPFCETCGTLEKGSITSTPESVAEFLSKQG
jgi:hypothetical protein